MLCHCNTKAADKNAFAQTVLRIMRATTTLLVMELIVKRSVTAKPISVNNQATETDQERNQRPYLNLRYLT